MRPLALLASASPWMETSFHAAAGNLGRFRCGPAAVKHRSQPARAPKTKLKPSVSQKWLRATLAGINGFGNSKTVVQQAKKSAAAKADSGREAWSIRTSGYRHAM